MITREEGTRAINKDNEMLEREADLKPFEVETLLEGEEAGTDVVRVGNRKLTAEEIEKAWENAKVVDGHKVIDLRLF